MEHVEHIDHNHQPLAYIIRAALKPSVTTFLTPPEFKQQVGFVVYPRGGEVKRHLHLPIKRTLVGTSEVIIVKSGQCEIDLYSDDKQLVAMRELGEGDIVLMVSGGHGFRMLEDTVLLEIKQGPFTELEEKERF